VKTCCVLKADVYGYGSLMHARADAPVRQALDDAVRRWARGAAVVETGGDSALVAHDDPVALAQAARHIIDDVYQTTGQPGLRVALHYGEVHVQAGVGDEPQWSSGEMLYYVRPGSSHMCCLDKSGRRKSSASNSRENLHSGAQQR
jgi:class 3 adenylate cyclase